MAVELVIHTRPRNIGAFDVRRALPSMQRRLVGPFIFFDHMGPAELAPEHPLEVRPHPHIGLATVTYLFEGEIMHRDNLGYAQVIKPGDVNFMVAGRGIAHSERGTDRQRSERSKLHGIQLWLALPTALEETAPSFTHHPASTIPRLTPAPGVSLSIVLGTAWGVTSPVAVLSPTFYVEASLDEGAELELPLDGEQFQQRAAYVAEGEIETANEVIPTASMVIFTPGHSARIRALAPSKVMLLGGAQLDGERHIWWNFVSSSSERIERAKRDWQAGAFAKVPGDEVDFIPLPES